MPKKSRWKRFLLLWWLLFLSYLIIKAGFNWFVFGWIDLRKTAFLELLVLPLGQGVIFWCFYRPGRQ